MKRHVLIGIFGPQDNARVPTATDEQVTHVPLVIGQKSLNFGIHRALQDLKAIGVFPSEIGVDLLVLAAHVHAADTRICRTTESQDSWTREIRLVVPVSDHQRWTASSHLLARILNFLTGDKWSIGFRPRPAGFAQTVPPRPLIGPNVPFDGLNLFSGGLDSLIGAIDTLESGGGPLLVSHAGEGAVSDSQNNCFNALRKHYSKYPFNRLRYWVNFPTSLVRGVSSEDSMRGRSFLFFALGIFAATGIGHQPFVLKVPENGLIALNVPLDIVRLGSHSTRTTHPFYMARWNELLSRLGIAGTVENPYWNKTKGEMVSACTNKTLLKRIVPFSLSCSSPTKGRWAGRGTEHCGYCLPCIIRRASLETAFGRGKDPTAYAIKDLASRPLNTLRAEGQQIRSLQIAIERLRRTPTLAKILIHKSGSLSDQVDNLDELAAVYQRGMLEVAKSLTGTKTRPS
nr:Qat anti-phage system QueC-like protein QatC [Nitrosomonas nitrosa]